MYITKTLTTASCQMPDSYEISDELFEKFISLVPAVKLVFNDDETQVVDIIKDEDFVPYVDPREERRRLAEEKAESAKEGTQIILRKLFQANASSMTDDEVIQCRSFIEEYSEDKTYSAGDVCMIEGVPFRYTTESDSTVSTANTAKTSTASTASTASVSSLKSSTLRTATATSTPKLLWKPLHGTTKDTALPFKTPAASYDKYEPGECVKVDDVVYMATTTTATDPAKSDKDWTVVDDNTVTGTLPEAHGAP